MGSIRLGVPEDIALQLRDAMDLKWFIETGSYKGGTLRWAAENFENVVSIEMCEKYYCRLVGKTPENVRLVFGDSRTELAKNLPAEPAMLWLDAHWCGNYELSVNTPGECPLMEELQAIRDYDAILIDDARLFLDPPPRPHDPEQWPNFDQITEVLNGRFVTIIEDVIIAVPPEFEEALECW